MTESSSLNDLESSGKKEKGDEETMFQKLGMSTLQTLNDQSFFQKYLEFVA